MNWVAATHSTVISSVIATPTRNCEMHTVNKDTLCTFLSYCTVIFGPFLLVLEVWQKQPQQALMYAIPFVSSHLQPTAPKIPNYLLHRIFIRAILTLFTSSLSVLIDH